MPASALLAFQFLSLLWVVEMQETVRSFPVAGVSRLGIKGQKREALLRGETVTISLTTSACHWGWHCTGKSLLPGRRGNDVSGNSGLKRKGQGSPAGSLIQAHTDCIAIFCGC